MRWSCVKQRLVAMFVYKKFAGKIDFFCRLAVCGNGIHIF